MENKFEIIDDKGVIESNLNSFNDALQKLEELDQNPDFQQIGDLKIVLVYYIRA